MNSTMASELGGLVLLGSWSLALPAAVLTVLTLVIAGRKKALLKRSTTLIALGWSVVVGAAVMVALWALRGNYEDPVMLAILIPGASIIALLGAVPAGLVARWLLNNRMAAREGAPGFEAA